MKKIFTVFIIAMAMVIVSANTVSAEETQNNGQPFAELWNAINVIMDEISSIWAVIEAIELTEGPEGEPGPQGLQGEEGPQGSQGDIGADGAPGAAGISCWDLNGDGVATPEEDVNGDGNYDAYDCQGPAGADGTDGAAGATGADGATGPAGAKGDTGDTGPAGPQGPIGLTGDVGPQGLDGIMGLTGDVGPTGPQGSQGDIGPAGADGATGPQGIQGEVGLQGLQGLPGADGTDGTSCSVVDNSDGTKTISCTDGTTATVSDGQDGAQGIDGMMGLPGPQGPAGAEGTDGTSCSVVDNLDGTKTISCTDGTTATVSDGADGGQGPAGAKGDTGDTGPQGEQGEVGPAGADGAGGGGAKGDTGDTGEAGADGLSCWDLNADGIGDPAEDINGDGNFDALDCQGEQGLQGAAGPQGPSGPAGASGSQGPAGDDIPTCFATETVGDIALKLQIDGADIEGDSPVTSLDREDTIVVYGFCHEVSSGGIKGMHSNLVILKKIDKATLALYEAIFNGQPVDLELRFYRQTTGSSGAEEHYFTITLQNAQVVSIVQTSQESTETGSDNAEYEEVAFAFQDITWVYEGSGATAQDTAISTFAPLGGSDCSPALLPDAEQSLRIQEIPGDNPSSTLERQDTSFLYSVCHEIATAHNPITVVKRMDKATPLFYDALINNQLLNTVEIDYYRPSIFSDGTAENYYRITLTDAFVVSVDQVTAKSSLGSPLLHSAFEEITFVYGSIQLTWLLDGAVAYDMW